MDIARTPEVIDLDEVRPNNDGLAVKNKRRTSDQLALSNFDVSTKEGFQQLFRFQMRIFDQNYDFEADQLVGGVQQYVEDPSLEELYYYCKYIII